MSTVVAHGTVTEAVALRERLVPVTSLRPDTRNPRVELNVDIGPRTANENSFPFELFFSSQRRAGPQSRP